MYAETELQNLVALAKQAGAEIDVTFDASVLRDEGRRIIQTIQVKSGFAGFGPHPMSGFFACERLREAKAAGQLGPVVVSVAIGPMPRPMPAGMHDAMPNVVAKLSNGQTCTLFEFYPDELGFEAHEFLGLTVAEAKGLKAQKDREYLKSSQRQRYESAGG